MINYFPFLIYIFDIALEEKIKEGERENHEYRFSFIRPKSLKIETSILRSFRSEENPALFLVKIFPLFASDTKQDVNRNPIGSPQLMAFKLIARAFLEKFIFSLTNGVDRCAPKQLQKSNLVLFSFTEESHNQNQGFQFVFQKEKWRRKLIFLASCF